MKTIFKITFIAIIFSTLGSCSDDNYNIEEENLTENLIIKQITSDLRSDHNIELNSESLKQLQSFNVEEKNSQVISSEINNANFITLPIIENGNIIGRVVKSQNSYIYYDLSNWNRIINVFSLKNKENNVQFSTYLDEQNIVNGDFDTAIVNSSNNSRCSLGFTLCVAGCGVSALAIAASDGPAPIMDIYAVTYMATCTAGCGVSHCE